ncbi:TNF(Tumour Necrosis Factor) family protein, partial [Chryseobacterium sp. RU37D]
SPAANLDVAGNVKIADGTQGTGKVLTSDANGLASWKTPPITSNGSPILYVSAKSGTDIFWNNGSGWTDSTPGTLGWHPFVLKLNEATDINNIYDPSTGKITITEEGLYYIDSQISYMNTPSSSNPGFDGTSGHLFCELFISNQPSSIENISVIRGVKSTGNSTININRTVLLKPGDTIQILIYSYETANMNNDHTYPSIQRSVSNFELFKL